MENWKQNFILTFFLGVAIICGSTRSVAQSTMPGTDSPIYTLSDGRTWKIDTFRTAAGLRHMVFVRPDRESGRGITGRYTEELIMQLDDFPGIIRAVASNYLSNASPAGLRVFVECKGELFEHVFQIDKATMAQVPQKLLRITRVDGPLFAETFTALARPQDSVSYGDAMRSWILAKVFGEPVSTVKHDVIGTILRVKPSRYDYDITKFDPQTEAQSTLYNSRYSPFVMVALLSPFKFFSHIRDVETLDGMLVVTTSKFPFGSSGEEIFISARALKVGASEEFDRGEKYYNQMTEVTRVPIGLFSRVISKETNGQIAVVNTKSFMRKQKYQVLDLITGKVVTSGTGELTLGKTEGSNVRFKYQSVLNASPVEATINFAETDPLLNLLTSYECRELFGT